MRLFSSLLDIFFPEHCASCGKSGKSICKECIPLLPKADALPEDWMYAAFSYRSPIMRSLIHTLKYKGNYSVLEPLGPELAEEFKIFLSEDLRIYSHIALVPVPSPKHRVRERGYTQSYIVAKLLQKELKDPKVSTRTILKTTNHDSQVKTKSRKERLSNIRGVFYVDQEIDPHILYVIIDDVITTGATIKEIRSVLIKKGAQCVRAFAVAH